MLTPCFSVPSSNCEEFENNSDKKRKAVGSKVAKGRKRLSAKMVASDHGDAPEQSEVAKEQQSEALRHSEDGQNVTLSSLHTWLDGQEETIQRTLDRLLSFSAVLSTVQKSLTVVSEQVDNVKDQVGLLEAFAAARGDLDVTSTGASSVLPFDVQEQLGDLETRTAAEGIPTAASPVLGTAGQHVTESASQEQIAALQDTDPPLKRK